MASDPMTKLENAVKKLSSDLATLRAESNDFQGGTLEALANIPKTQTALTNALTQAIKEMAVTKSFDVRLSRLEAEVFGSKH